MTHMIEGTWEELEARKKEFIGHRLRLIVDPEEDNDYGAPEHLIIRDEAHLKQLLQEGINSGPAVPVTKEFWEEMRQYIRALPDNAKNA